MSKISKKLNIPKELESAWEDFLDIAQFNMPDSNDLNLTKNEQKVLVLVRKFLGNKCSAR